MDEFARIASYFQPLSRRQDGAFALTDDAAVLAVEPGKELVVCADAMVESIHFLPSMPPDRLASKLLRVNLSDLAAMGATPFAYLLTLAIPQGLGDAWLAGFADGLKADQERWSIDLVGGDSTSTDGPISASITAMGTVEPGAILRRSGARVGDDIYVTGTVGDGALGLKAARGDLDGAPTDAVAYLADRYVAPTPRVEIGQALSGLASAAIDVSDGLMADLGHIARESNVGARIRAADVPLSSAAKEVIEFDQNLRKTALTAGDDYELVFCAEPGGDERISTVSNDMRVPITKIGSIIDTNSVTMVDQDDRIIELNPGWQHF